jgi:hypothetical protein
MACALLENPAVFWLVLFLGLVVVLVVVLDDSSGKDE